MDTTSSSDMDQEMSPDDIKGSVESLVDFHRLSTEIYKLSFGPCLKRCSIFSDKERRMYLTSIQTFIFSFFCKFAN